MVDISIWKDTQKIQQDMSSSTNKWKLRQPKHQFNVEIVTAITTQN